jgi:hypothetical protein
MATLRIDTLDDSSGQIYVELFHEPGHEPVITTPPMYGSHDEAMEKITNVLRAAWPNPVPNAIDPTIGV